MVVKDYTYYLWQFAELVFASPYGYVAIALLLAAIVLRLVMPHGRHAWPAPLPLIIVLVSLTVFVTGLYSVEYEFDIPLDRLEQAKTNPDDEDCGSAWTNWLPAGSGLMHTCPKGCYRGITLRQKMKLTQFPPWPKTNRELKCWRRTPMQESLAALPE